MSQRFHPHPGGMFDNVSTLGDACSVTQKSRRLNERHDRLFRTSNLLRQTSALVDQALTERETEEQWNLAYESKAFCAFRTDQMRQSELTSQAICVKLLPLE